MRYTDVIFKKGAALLQAFILLLHSAAIADEAAMDGMVRVYLSSLGNRTRVDLTVCGSYSLDGTAATAIDDNSKLSVSVNSATGQMTLTANGVSQAMGQGFRLRRHRREDNNGVKISQTRVSANLYPGDVQFKALKSGGSYRLQMIVREYGEK